MAIKGKKKSQQRGSQARRRPAMAPRPAPGRAQKVPWYKTTKGQTIAGISALILIVVGLAMFSNAKKEADERAQAQETLENYTDQVSALQQRISQAATEMAAAALASPDDLADADVEEWTTTFTGAQAETAQFFAPEEASASSQLFTQSINLFKAAAETFAVVGDLEAKQQQELLSAVSTQVQTASGVWEAGVTVLDDARDEVELNASGITSPVSNTQPAIQATPGATSTPGASATIPVSPGVGGGGAGGGAGGGGGGKNKKGDDS